MSRLFVTGDTHGDYGFLDSWCAEYNTTEDDILIILGDSAIRFEGADSRREINRKHMIEDCPITICAVQGNHDRPLVPPYIDDLEEIIGPQGNKFLHDKNCHNVYYFINGQTYYLNGKSFLPLGGAFSIDKEYRQVMHWTWYPEEQLTPEEQTDIFDEVKHKHYDYVLSHTCPINWQPVDLFMTNIHREVDSRTEYWLSKIEETIDYNHWFFGHYHADRQIYNKVRLFYNLTMEIENE